MSENLFRVYKLKSAKKPRCIRRITSDNSFMIRTEAGDNLT